MIMRALDAFELTQISGGKPRLQKIALDRGAMDNRGRFVRPNTNVFNYGLFGQIA